MKGRRVVPGGSEAGGVGSVLKRGVTCKGGEMMLCGRRALLLVMYVCKEKE